MTGPETISKPNTKEDTEGWNSILGLAIYKPEGKIAYKIINGEKWFCNSYGEPLEKEKHHKDTLSDRDT